MAPPGTNTAGMSIRAIAFRCAGIDLSQEEDNTMPKLTILGLDGTIYIGGDTHGLWTFIYDVYGNLWYERPSVNNWISLPGQRVYVVRVGNSVRKVYLN